MKGTSASAWRTHVLLILIVSWWSFVLNQAPFVFSSKPYSIGDDGDSAFHVAIQMKLRDPTLFPKDIELNEMYLHSRPAFEFIIHRFVIWLADHLFSNNLFAANIVLFWSYHLFFIVGCYVLGLVVLESPGGAALFTTASVGLSMALVAWWGMVYAAVVPHTIGLALTPWFVIGYLHWIKQPRRLVAMFLMLGLAVNIYPLQPTFLALILVAVTLLRCQPTLAQSIMLGIAFTAGALPSVLTSASSTFGELTALSPANRAVIDALFVRHYSYLLLISLRRTAGVIVTAPVWWFLVIAGGTLFLKHHERGLSETDKRLSAFAVWTAALSLGGLVVGAIYRPLITFLFHRASAFLYIPAYLGCAWMATYWIRQRTATSLIAGSVLALLMLLNSAQNTALARHLRGPQPMPSSSPYYALADWAAKNTPADSLFMTPFGPTDSYYAFRVYSAQGVLLHWGTGEIVISHPQAAPLFWEMANDIEPLYTRKSDTVDFLRVAHKYHVDYIITDPQTPQPPDLPVAYRNEVYTVYAVPPGWP